MPDIPSTIAELVETFDRNIEAYRCQEYNEAQLRREFIDPFFEELGWR
jgi:predicted type IV restriction endonuclease